MMWGFHCVSVCMKPVLAFSSKRIKSNNALLRHLVEKYLIGIKHLILQLVINKSHGYSEINNKNFQIDQFMQDLLMVNTLR